jgi:hypothetical protein
MAIGAVTRGTTGTNRLRRVDRWIASRPVLRSTTDPLVVDLGFGASAVTTLELQRRLATVRADVDLLGLEIDRARVRTALAELAIVRAGGTAFGADALISFAHGGFEVPMPNGRSAAVIRAFNVLRQYDEEQVPDAWRRLTTRLQPGGLLVEGTCDEIGRVSSWVGLGVEGPQTFTLSLRLADLDSPAIVAERLPKALIHRNVPGERIHALIGELERHWRGHAPLATFGPVQRWLATVRSMRDAGWPVLDGPRRWRLGELGVPWSAVAPLD